MIMSGKKAMDKGKRAEREVAHLLQPFVNQVYAQFPDLGAPPLLQRNLMQTHSGGYDLIGLEWLALEVKFQESLKIPAWWTQTLNQCGHGQVPVLFFKQSRKSWRVCVRGFLPTADGKRFFSRSEIPLENFKAYFVYELTQRLQQKQDALDELPNAANVMADVGVVLPGK